MPPTTVSDAGKDVVRPRTESWVEEDQDPLYRRVAVEILPDDVLREIFNFYVEGLRNVDGWHPLVHVCRRWRYVVFASPRRLNLRLYCTNRRPVRKMLDIWPELPIIIWNDFDSGRDSLVEGADNIIAALECNERVHEIHFGGVSSWLLESFGAVMQGPFPSLTSLHLRSDGESVVALPDYFLGEPAPRLRALRLINISFPVPIFQKLPLVASDLVNLCLWGIPDSGHYISPETMVNCLAAFTRLRVVDLEYSPQSLLNRASRRLPPLTRVVLPALTSFRFDGASEYLEDFVARIDAPLLRNITVVLQPQPVYNNPQLLQLVGRAERLKASNQVALVFSKYEVVIRLSQQTEPVNHTGLATVITCARTDDQLSSLAQICWSLPYLSHFTLERLIIRDDRRRAPDWHDEIENFQWLGLLLPFRAVKDLYLSKDVAPRIAPFLQEIAGKPIAGVLMLPSLQNLFLEEPQASGPIQEATEQFVAARQLNGHPVAILDWERGKGRHD